MLMAIEPEAVFPAALIVGGQQRPGGVLLEAKTSERHRRPLPTSEVGSASLGDGHLIGLDAEIEAMIEDMAAAAPESRAASAWGPTGASTLKYLELTNQQAEIEAHVIELRRAIAAEEGKATPLQ